MKSRDGRSAIARLEQSGASRMLFSQTGVEGIILNTAGGVTGGDRFAMTSNIAAGSRAQLTTQAAERLYRANDGETGTIDAQFCIDGDLHWLPQETIVFNGARVRRKFQADLSKSAKLLFVEPVAYGRLAMGEEVTNADFRDSVTLRREGALIYRDTTHLRGNIAQQLDRPAIGNGARASALVLYAATDAEARLEPARRLTPNVSLVSEGLLAARFLAKDSFELRKVLVPFLTQFTDLPRSWSL